MIVLINGPFGVGKTSVARLLAPRLGARIYDPERIGWVLRRLWPIEDYQDAAIWRRLVVVGARLMKLRHDVLLVPMTFWQRTYFDEIVHGLRSIDADVRCVRLTATEAVLRERILASDESQAWRLAHLESGIAALADAHFGMEIRAEGSPGEIARELEGFLE